MTIQQFDGIPEFILAAQFQSFTAAAVKMGVTSSAIGKAVSRLETRLGVKLLHRTTRKISLTSEGEAYLASCLRAAEDLGNTEELLSTGLSEPRGQLRISLPGAFGRRHIAPTLIALARKYPKLDLTMTFGDRTVDLINEGIDVAVRIGDLHSDPELVAHQLGEQYLVICCSPDYLLRRGPIEGPTAFTEQDCIIGWRRGGRVTWLLKGDHGKTEHQEINARHELGDGEMMVQGVLDGCGISQLPTWLIHDHLRSGAIVTVLDEYAGVRMPINVIWPRSRFAQPKTQIAIAALRQLASENPVLFTCGPPCHLQSPNS